MRYVMLVCSDPSIELTAEQRETIGPEVRAWVQEMDGRGVRVQGHELYFLAGGTVMGPDERAGAAVTLADRVLAGVSGGDHVGCALGRSSRSRV